MENLFQKRKKQLIIVAVAMIALVLIVSAFFIIRSRIYSATLNVVVSPSIARIKVGDKEYDLTGEIKLKPGEYEMEVYADGFISKKGKLTAVEDETFDLALYLEPTAENDDWYETHPWDATVRGDIANNAEIKKYYDLKNVEPILEYVPYNTFKYSISYEEDCAENGGEVCLVVKGDMGMRDVAVQYLQSTGEDLSRYKIKMNDYAEPFKDAQVSVPDGLDFSDDTSSVLSKDEVGDMTLIANNFIKSSLASGKYRAEILQIKRYGDYCGLKVKVYSITGDEKNYDTYRMIVGKVNNKWTALTNLDWVLSAFDNPKLPRELLKEVNLL